MSYSCTTIRTMKNRNKRKETSPLKRKSHF